MMPVLCSAKKAFVIEKDRTIIVTGEQPSPSVILAAHELQHFIKQSLDIHLPIVSEVPQQPSKIIFVGGSKYTEKVRFKEQEYLIEITPETITLMGQDENFDTDGGRDNNGITPSKDRTKINYSQSTGDPSAPAELNLPSIYDAQGTCYAVYDFLENYLGIRFYGPDSLNIIVPKQKNLKLSPVRIMRAPVLKYRDGSYSFRLADDERTIFQRNFGKFTAIPQTHPVRWRKVGSQPCFHCLSGPLPAKESGTARNYSKAIIPNTSQ